MVESLKELNSFIEKTTKETIDSYSKEYKESIWYRPPVLEEVFGDTIYRDIVNFKKALENGCDLHSFINDFETAAKNYAASWFDEDLHCLRVGYAWETEVYVTLRNIAAIKECESTIPFEAFYEGRGV